MTHLFCLKYKHLETPDRVNVDDIIRKMFLGMNNKLITNSWKITIRKFDVRTYGHSKPLIPDLS